MSSKAASKDPTALGYVVLISCVAATGGFLFGYDTAVINGTGGALERHFQADAGRLGAGRKTRIGQRRSQFHLQRFVPFISEPARDVEDADIRIGH